jgi:hypothetical protein
MEDVFTLLVLCAKLLKYIHSDIFYLIYAKN